MTTAGALPDLRLSPDIGTRLRDLVTGLRAAIMWQFLFHPILAIQFLLFRRQFDRAFHAFLIALEHLGTPAQAATTQATPPANPAPSPPRAPRTRQSPRPRRARAQAAAAPQTIPQATPIRATPLSRPPPRSQKRRQTTTPTHA